ncbi:MAG: molecular chaperone HtpG [Myxococcales bacterium FL481]|nr:MAG: molecular chaperone HtpG [Myxococcales bacterium FL481]
MSSSTPEQHEFKAEVTALLRLVTHSLYTNREIFLRELVSNASDAIDKARFQALVEPDLADKDVAPEIRITADKQNRVLTIEDTGIGMTRAEATENLGTIAHSGTLRYLSEAKAAGKEIDLNLIGQFGVGFYSAFMVGDRVEVHTRSGHAGSEPVCWSSAGDGQYTLAPTDQSRRGTKVVVHLKEDADEFLDRYRIEAIIKRYSNYVMHPIRLTTIDAEGKSSADAENASDEQINAASAFWSRDPKSLSDEDYQEFYKSVMGGFVMPGDEPHARLHFSMDAPIQFDALLFVPGNAPVDLFMEDRKAVQLYARRVLVMDSCDKLLPNYLRFFRGVVDSEDLPLNVSREMLQEHKSLAAIRRQLTRKAIRLLADTAKDDGPRYAKIWGEFGPVLKEGIHTDAGHRDELVELLRWRAASATDDELKSLREYVDAMPSDQDTIYYIVGEDSAALRASPHLEAVRGRGHDVLLMTDTVDEWVMQSLTEYDGKKFRSVTQGEIEGDSNEESDDKASPSAIDNLLEAAKTTLGDRVKTVRASKRLTDSASCLVDEQGGLSRNMQRILRHAQRSVPERPRILELNPDHPFVRKANDLAQSEAASDRLTTWVHVLHDLAAMAEGQVPDPAGSVKRIQSVLNEAAGL